MNINITLTVTSMQQQQQILELCSPFSIAPLYFSDNELEH